MLSLISSSMISLGTPAWRTRHANRLRSSFSGLIAPAIKRSSTSRGRGTAPGRESSAFARSVGRCPYPHRAELSRSPPVPRTPDRGKHKSIHQGQLLRLAGYNEGRVEDRHSGLGLVQIANVCHSERDLRRTGYSGRLFTIRDYSPSARVELSYNYSTMVEASARRSSPSRKTSECAKYADISDPLDVFDKYGTHERGRISARSCLFRD